MTRILLVEDDSSLGETLRDRLKRESFDVHWAKTVFDAQALIRANDFDLVVLDVGLPDGSGFEFASEIRRRENPPPFLFVTAQNSAEDRLKGYELGAEEFIPKPFHLKEFLLRIHHVLEKHVEATAKDAIKRVSLQDRTIDFESRSVRMNDGRIEFLPEKDIALLRLLVSEAPRVVSRDEMLDRVWGEGEFPSTRTIDNVIVRIRQAIGDQGGDRIRSVRGVGYQWVFEDKV